jgi:hypothetical protein
MITMYTTCFSKGPDLAINFTFREFPEQLYIADSTCSLFYSNLDWVTGLFGLFDLIASKTLNYNAFGFPIFRF